jgi:hypothetical protein
VHQLAEVTLAALTDEEKLYHLKSLAAELGFKIAPKSKRARDLRDRTESIQEVGTPPAFLLAVERRFGEITFDAAATHANAVCADYYTLEREQNSLVLPWPRTEGWIWLNYEFRYAGLWTAKARAECVRPWCGQDRDREPRNALLLGLASIGTQWYLDNVHGFARVYPVGRLQFVGSPDPCGSDLMLMAYGPRAGEPGVEPWRNWRDWLTSDDKDVLRKGGYWL